MLERADLIFGSRQDKNAGNSGDLIKHTVYVVLARSLTQRPPSMNELNIVEAHAGKGVYLSTSPHLRKFRASPAYPGTVLGRAQTRAFSAPPTGLGTVTNLGPNEIPYAGSAVLHAFELAALSDGRLTLLDHDAGVRGVLDPLLRQPAFDHFRDRAGVIESDQESERLVLASLNDGQYQKTHVLHFDPFAFVMSDTHSAIRSIYRQLLQLAGDRVATGAIAALSVFFTWGSNSSAALEDLDGKGWFGGLQGGYQDLIELVDTRCRVVVTWCWGYYFSMLLVIAPHLRSDLLESLRSALAPFKPFLSRLTLQ